MCVRMVGDECNALRAQRKVRLTIAVRRNARTAILLHLKVMVTGSKGRSPSSCEGCRFSMPTGALNASTPTLAVKGNQGKERDT